jgi:hypothetical protein
MEEADDTSEDEESPEVEFELLLPIAAGGEDPITAWPPRAAALPSAGKSSLCNEKSGCDCLADGSKKKTVKEKIN